MEDHDTMETALLQLLQHALAAEGNKVNSKETHPQVMLNKLRFDFRNAKPAFLGASYCKVDESRTKPNAQQTELSCNETSGQIDTNPVDNKNTIVAESCNTGQHIAGTAVQVNDGELDIAAVTRHSCREITKSKPAGKNCSFPSGTTESDSRLLLSYSAVANNNLPPSNAPSSSVTSSARRMERNVQRKQAELPCHQKNTASSEQTDVTVGNNKTDLGVSLSFVLKTPLTAVIKRSSDKDSITHTLQSINHGKTESSGSGGYSESLLPSSSSPAALYDDIDDDIPLSWRKNVVQSVPVSRVAKSRKSENVRFLRDTTAASIADEREVRDTTPKAVRTRKRRRRKKCDSADAQKKLLLMPVEKKSGRGRKPRMKRDVFAVTRKHKRHKSATVEEMELPDLSAVLDNDALDMSDVLKMYDWQPDMDDSALTDVSQKWSVDVTGADLDIDCKQVKRRSQRQQKSAVSIKPAEQNVYDRFPRLSTDTRCYFTNFSTSQETPPQSATSNTNSTCSEQDQGLSDEEEMQNPEDSRRFSIDTKVAHYIDGRRFDRLVNGVSVRVSSVVIDEMTSQIGQEYLSVAKLNKREVKELQDQVRLEEIYHRRAQKATLLLYDRRSGNVRRRACQQHNVSQIMRRSAARRAAESIRIAHCGIETEDTDADEVNGHVLFALKSHDDPPLFLSSNAGETTDLNNLFSKPDGVQTRSVDMRTGISHIGAGSTGNNEYIAAVALASLSMTAENQLHSTSLTLASEYKTSKEIASEKKDKTPIAVTSKPSHRRTTERSTVTETCEKKLSKTATVTNSHCGHHVKDGEGSCSVSSDKHCEHTTKAVSEDARGDSKVHRSKRHRISHSAKPADRHKTAAVGNEMSSSTCLSKSAVNTVIGSEREPTKTSVISGIAADSFPNTNHKVASDKTKHRKDKSRNHKSDEKKAVSCQERNIVVGANSLNCNASMSRHAVVDSLGHHLTHISDSQSDAPAEENSSRLNNKITASSGGRSTNDNVLCGALRGELLDLTTPSALCSDSRISSRETETSVNLQPEMNPSTENPDVETNPGDTIKATATIGCEVFSDLNSNNVLKSLPVSYSCFTGGQCNVTDRVQIASDNAVGSVVELENEILPQSCAVAGNSNNAEATNSVILEDCTSKLPNSPYRESEDIRSPSPMVADPVEDDCCKEIRSPSPCDMESSAGEVCIIETSWDVAISSPCEIQSPDCSDNEAEDCVEHFSRQCNVCFQHGPVTIPLTIEEASKTMHNH